MKKGVFLVLNLFLILMLQAPNASADVTEGNASTHIEVHTDVGGQGSVSTHIESTVNGNKQVFDSNKPGDTVIDNNGTSSSVTQKPLPSTPSATITPFIKKPLQQSNRSLFQEIELLFKHIFTFFSH